MASVTFPTALGGDGKTYSDDADPDTGLDGLGYVNRFVPCLKNAVAMAGYTAQYAAKIDAAAANADRAEHARGYIEAVSGAINIDIVGQFRSKSSLCLNFIKGEYWKDNGVKFKSTEIVDIASLTRNSSKMATSPGGYLKSYHVNTVARHWKEFGPVGFLSSFARTNYALHSQDFSKSSWSRGDHEYDYNAEIAPDGTLTATRIAAGTSVMQPRQLISGLVEGMSICGSVYAKAKNSSWIRLRVNNRAVWFDLVGNQVGTNYTKGVARIESIGNGWVRISTGEEVEGTSVFFEIIPVSGNAQSTPAGSVCLWGAQLEQGTYPSPYKATTDSIVTDGTDTLQVNVDEIINRRKGTFFVDIDNLVINSTLSTRTNIFGFNQFGVELTNTSLVFRSYIGGNEITFGGYYSREIPGRIRMAFAYDFDSSDNFSFCVNGRDLTAASQSSDKSFWESATAGDLYCSKRSPISPYAGDADDYTCSFGEVFYLPTVLSPGEIQRLTEIQEAS